MSIGIRGRKSLDHMGTAFENMLEAFNDTRNIKNLSGEQIDNVINKITDVADKFKKYKIIRQKQSVGGKLGSSIKYKI
jgi:hypothetical protein